MKKISLLIADDHPVFRQGLRNIIESDPGFQVLREAADGAEALRLIRELKPDVAILDLDMPQMTGIEVVRALRSGDNRTEVVVLTMHKEEDVFNEAIDAGAKGYVLKESAVPDILNSIRAAAEGRHYISPDISDFLMRRRNAVDAFAARTPGLSLLTLSERRILRLVAASKTSKEIADELGVSARTVENHRANIGAKLNLRGIHSLVKFAFEHRGVL
jgi:DNA-binding NarL/FixJ family response regulator